MAKNYLYLIHLPVEKSEKPISNFNSIGWLYIEKKKKKTMVIHNISFTSLEY